MVRTPLLVLLASLVSVPAQAALLNPGFETGNLDSWDVGGDVAVVACAGADTGCAPAGGTYLAMLNQGTGLGSSSLTQAVWVAGAGAYHYGAWVSYGTNVAAGNFAQGQVSLTVSGAGVSSVVGYDPNALQGQFTIPGSAQFSFTPWFLLTGILHYDGVGPAQLLINLNVQNSSSQNGLKLAVDNAFVTLAPVPEPATFILFGAGLVSMGASLARSRRRRR